MKCTKTEVKECNVSKCYNAIKENVNKCCKCSQERHRVQFVEEEKTEQNQKSIAACTINCWSNVTEKLIQCEQHIHTDLSKI